MCLWFGGRSKKSKYSNQQGRDKLTNQNLGYDQPTILFSDLEILLEKLYKRLEDIEGQISHLGIITKKIYIHSCNPECTSENDSTSYIDMPFNSNLIEEEQSNCTEIEEKIKMETDTNPFIPSHISEIMDKTNDNSMSSKIEVQVSAPVLYRNFKPPIPTYETGTYDLPPRRDIPDSPVSISSHGNQTLGVHSLYGHPSSQVKYLLNSNRHDDMRKQRLDHENTEEMLMEVRKIITDCKTLSKSEQEMWNKAIELKLFVPPEESKLMETIDDISNESIQVSELVSYRNSKSHIPTYETGTHDLSPLRDIPDSSLSISAHGNQTLDVHSPYGRPSSQVKNRHDDMRTQMSDQENTENMLMALRKVITNRKSVLESQQDVWKEIIELKLFVPPEETKLMETIEDVPSSSNEENLTLVLHSLSGRTSSQVNNLNNGHDDMRKQRLDLDQEIITEMMVMELREAYSTSTSEHQTAVCIVNRGLKLSVPLDESEIIYTIDDVPPSSSIDKTLLASPVNHDFPTSYLNKESDVQIKETAACSGVHASLEDSNFHTKKELLDSLKVKKSAKSKDNKSSSSKGEDKEVTVAKEFRPVAEQKRQKQHELKPPGQTRLRQTGRDQQILQVGIDGFHTMETLQRRRTKVTRQGAHPPTSVQQNIGGVSKHHTSITNFFFRKGTCFIPY